MTSLCDFLNPSFQAFTDSVVNANVLTVFDWTRLACTSKDIASCVQRLFADLTYDHITLLLRTFFSAMMRTNTWKEYKMPLGCPLPKASILWSYQINPIDPSKNKSLLVRTRPGVSPEYTYITAVPLLQSTDRPTLMYCYGRYTAYFPMLNESLKRAVDRISGERARTKQKTV
jgi:hypothetical protein